MKHLLNFKTGLIGGIIFLSVFSITMVYSHCQIPCGIYDDPARIKMLAEQISSIQKAINQINRLSDESNKNYNQLVRWINNKDEHADALNEIVTYYFMAQRIKPVDKSSGPAYEAYVDQLTTLHKIQITAMKCKQTTDLDNVGQLRELLGAFEKMYMKEAGHAH